MTIEADSEAVAGTAAGPNESLRTAAIACLEAGNVAEARRLIDKALSADPSARFSEGWSGLADMDSWPDGWLIAAVRSDPPDEAALDTLVARYWKRLFAHCQMLTMNHQKATDLAQEVWCRVLRARRTLRPDGNFAGFILTIGTNLWRDSQRSAKRAGPMAEHRLASLDADLSNDEGETVALVDIVPDLSALDSEKRTLLVMDIDRGLEGLPPLLREVLVSRFLVGESCVEIGRRHGRTEQTVSGWVREGIRQMKHHLEDGQPAELSK